MTNKVKFNLEGLTDVELVAEFKNGNELAYDSLIERYAGKMYAVSYGMLNNKQDAEEVVQDAFMRAYKAFESFRGDASFRTWMQRIVMNLSRNKYNWNKRRGADINISLSAKSLTPEFDDDNDFLIPDVKLGPARIIESKEFEESLMGAFEELPEKIREPMLLRHLENLSYCEISDLLDCKIGTVKSRLARGRELLRKFVKSNRYR